MSHLAARGGELGVEAAGQSLGHQPRVGGEHLGLQHGVQHGGVLGGEGARLPGQSEGRQAADGEALVLPGQAGPGGG